MHNVYISMIVMMRRVTTYQMMRKGGKNRELLRKKKQKERNTKNKCEKCDFIGKTAAGLKTHLWKKH